MQTDTVFDPGLLFSWQPTNPLAVTGLSYCLMTLTDCASLCYLIICTYHFMIFKGNATEVWFIIGAIVDVWLSR